MNFCSTVESNTSNKKTNPNSLDIMTIKSQTQEYIWLVGIPVIWAAEKSHINLTVNDWISIKMTWCISIASKWDVINIAVVRKNWQQNYQSTNWKWKPTKHICISLNIPFNVLLANFYYLNCGVITRCLFVRIWLNFSRCMCACVCFCSLFYVCNLTERKKRYCLTNIRAFTEQFFTTRTATIITTTFAQSIFPFGSIEAIYGGKKPMYRFSTHRFYRL